MSRILVIDALDADRVRDSLSLNTQHIIVTVVTAADGLETLPLTNPHLIVMDHVLPDTNGLMLLPQFGKRGLVVLSAADDQQTRVMALRAGADDFIRKPWDTLELLERVEAVLRRVYSPPRQTGAETIVLGDLAVDYGDTRYSGLSLALTKTEHLLLATLARNPGKVLKQSQVMTAIYGVPDGSDWHSIQVHIGRLRRKLNAAGATNVTLRTVRGMGLTLEHVARA